MALETSPNGHAAVLCAFHNGNAGMYSVDLAAHQFLKDVGIAFDLYVGQTDAGNSFHKYGGMNFKVCRDQAELQDYSHIIYWGDFLNNPVYGKAEYSYQEVGLKRSETLSLGYEAWKKVMLPDRSKLSSSRVISVSNNFQGVDQKISGGEADELAENFKTGFDAILPRDPYGLHSLRSLFPSAAGGYVEQGIDAAFLWDPHREFTLSREAKKPYFSYHFGRSNIQNSDALVRAISRATGLEARPLDGWLACRPRPREMMEGLVRQMAASRFVVSDTYHCCVNAMNLDVPVIGLGRSASEQIGTLGDYKKFALFDMFNLSHRYFGFREKSIHPSEMEPLVSTAIVFGRDGAPSSEFDALQAKKAVYNETLRSVLLGSE